MLFLQYPGCLKRTVRAGNLAPDDTDVGAANLTLGTVDECHLLAKVELCGLGVLNTVNLDQAGVGVGGVLGALVAQVAAPVKQIVLILCNHDRVARIALKSFIPISPRAEPGLTRADRVFKMSKLKIFQHEMR